MNHPKLSILINKYLIENYNSNETTIEIYNQWLRNSNVCIQDIETGRWCCLLIEKLRQLPKKELEIAYKYDNLRSVTV